MSAATPICPYCGVVPAGRCGLYPGRLGASLFREIEAYPGYRVGSNGSVWSEWNSRWGRSGTWRRRKLVPSKRGYLTVVLYNTAGRRRFYVHHLVLRAFVGPRPSGLEGCHEDCNHQNNRACNLRWDTSAGNRADTIRAGRFARGEKMPHAKLDPEKVRAARIAYSQGRSAKSLARLHEVALNTMLKALRRQTWTHVS